MEKLKVLVVEDNKVAQKLYDHGLVSAVFDKRFVDNGKDALEVYSSWQPDIIMLDYIMPVMDGYSVLKEIRENIGDNSTIIIMVTFMYPEEGLRDCFKLGIQGYIVKPFKFREITDVILNYYKKNNPERGKALQTHLKKAFKEKK